ncbi:hypothetical protein CROQUDRAFT_141408 [Cronartium quercuum f. sp. fusiforme G11]|uniref:Uncharacterized protein n=1 Tax=Cronartium quercuum f. sp. fusiforme G11 TaxID=708437 RepID=A0A9P6NVH1_9BASI|nr:hypothetical protein CROQUDRAFT_141408 [Cronartium quercuum f. sp. fusiforme G11]
MMRFYRQNSYRSIYTDRNRENNSIQFKTFSQKVINRTKSRGHRFFFFFFFFFFFDSRTLSSVHSSESEKVQCNLVKRISTSRKMI